MVIVPSLFDYRRYDEFLHLQHTWKMVSCHTPKVLIEGLN